MPLAEEMKMETVKLKHLIASLQPSPRFPTPYHAGVHAALNGANTENSHFGWFNSKVNSEDWQKGYNAAKAAKEPA